MDEPETPDVPEAKADHTLLDQNIAYAESLSEEDLKDLNSIVRAEFDVALAEAKAVGDDADQAAVNAAWMRLSRAIQMLEFTSNKAELNALIAQAEVIEADLNSYKEEGKQAFVDALNHAREIAASDTALDASINEAAAALEAAMNPLEKEEVQVNLTMLQLLVETANEAAEEDYTPATWAAFAPVLAEAKAVLAAPESQGQINAMASRLNSAWMNLRVKPSEDVLNALRSFEAQSMRLDFSAFEEADALMLTQLHTDVKAGLANENLTQEEAADLLDRILAVKDLTGIDPTVKPD